MKTFAVFLLVFMSAARVYSADCSVSRYEELVSQGKAAESGREWDKVVDIYSNILSDCRSIVPVTDLPKAYDSLSSAQFMLSKYQDALDNCEKCIIQDNRYNACMMTAARVYEALGNTQRAIESARDAAAVEPYDDYSAAVSIVATDFLRRLKQK